MMPRCFAFAALTVTLSMSVAAAQAPAPPAPTTPANRGRTAVPPGSSPATPAPAPAPGDVVPPPPPPAPAAPASTPVPRRENQSTNIRVDVTVTDQRPTTPALTKTVSVVTGDGLNGSVRSQTNYQVQNGPGGSAPFNVDARPVILADGKVYVSLTVQYDVVPPVGPNQGESAPVRLFGTTVRDSVGLILESGKPIVAVQSTDPVSDRKVSIEVKATVLK